MTPEGIHTGDCLEAENARLRALLSRWLGARFGGCVAYAELETDTLAEGVPLPSLKPEAGMFA